jgi:PadR family transcriptional regulator, regulatory protein PadR
MTSESTAGTDDGFVEQSRIFRDLMLGFVRVHVLHHAAIEPIYGSGISAELSRHGYRLSWGTLYPLLHNLEAEGFLSREDQIVDGKIRKYYRITPRGQGALDETRRKALELVDEITDGEYRPIAERVPETTTGDGPAQS